MLRKLNGRVGVFFPVAEHIIINALHRHGAAGGRARRYRSFREFVHRLKAHRIIVVSILPGYTPVTLIRNLFLKLKQKPMQGKHAKGGRQ